ncbi:DMT family transporter [Castellaniella defragrans]|uniref:DMT family transporter n=1 Tax=Castellaniella defragrans TaxID=75697 RepID=UPI002AFF67F1|nr:SMR family transporter [Castellaniella defragrans]
MKWLIVLLGILANTLASVLVKYATTPPRRLPVLSGPLAALSNWPFWLSLLCYGAAFVLYALALTRLPLHVVHPILTAGAIATVALLSGLLFQEQFQWTTLLGIGLVMAGVVLITVQH